MLVLRKGLLDGEEGTILWALANTVCHSSYAKGMLKSWTWIEMLWCFSPPVRWALLDFNVWSIPSPSFSSSCAHRTSQLRSSAASVRYRAQTAIVRGQCSLTNPNRDRQWPVLANEPELRSFGSSACYKMVRPVLTGVKPVVTTILDLYQLQNQFYQFQNDWFYSCF